MVAEMQPLIEFDVPTSPEAGDITLRMDETQMRKRSTRRLSRRFSLIPGDGSPRKLPMVSRSPRKILAAAVSPVKRHPVTLSPTKVADSPLRSFRVNATPTKVVLESPKMSPPEKSPLKPSSSSAVAPQDVIPNTPVNVTEPESAEHPPVSPVPLLFDQPTPELEAESKQETRRRISLQSARRNDRGSSGFSRLLALKKGRNSPNRRHSFTSLDLAGGLQEGTKNRRNTLDVFCVGPEKIRGAVAAQTGPHDSKVEEVVEIDMKTSLDIFGQPAKAVEPALQSHIEEQSGVAPPLLETESLSTPAAATTSSIEDAPAPGDVISSSTHTDRTCDTKEEGAGMVEESHPCQAATGPKADHTKTPENDPVAQASLGLSTAKDSMSSGSEEEKPQDMFAPYDPEGLSTIYEESSLMIEQDSEKDVVQTADQDSTLDAASQSSSENERSSEEELSETSVTTQSKTSTRATSPAPSTQDEQGAGDMPEACVAKASTNHVATASDALSPSDSPQLEREADMAAIAQLQAEDEANTTSEDSSTTPPPGDDICGAVPLDLESESSGQPAEAMQQELPGTPKTDGSLAPQEASGFTPINGRQISPPSASATPQDGQVNVSSLGQESGTRESDDVDDDEDDDEVDALVENGLRVENDTLDLQALHEDSETEMLRKFVTRVTADKNAKAAAAAALAEKNTRRKRRAGSTGSVPSTGSPAAKSELDARTPLGEKSPNSSPTKKRKLDDIKDDLVKDKDEAHDSTEPATEGPQPKRRRKRGDPALEDANAVSAMPSPEPESVAPTITNTSSGPRRSTRARSTRVALRPAAPSANSVALSMIPVRLPGMGAMDDEGAALEAHLAAMARQRSAEKDLAAVTRANTRKNKAGAVLPQVVLQMQAEDPNWRMRELKGIWEAKEGRRKKDVGLGSENEGEVEGKQAGKKEKAKKGVKWAEELVQFQEQQPSGITGAAREGLAEDVVMGEVDVDMEVDEIAEAAPAPPVTAPAVTEKRVIARRAAGSSNTTPASSTATAATTTRRTRSSRLQAPTPVKKMTAVSSATDSKTSKTIPAPSATSCAPRTTRTTRTLPKPVSVSTPASAPTPVPVPAAAPKSRPESTTATGMATRRTRITRLGMGVNGTPAKRRGRTAA